MNANREPCQIRLTRNSINTGWGKPLTVAWKAVVYSNCIPSSFCQGGRMSSTHDLGTKFLQMLQSLPCSVELLWFHALIRRTRGLQNRKHIHIDT